MLLGIIVIIFFFGSFVVLIWWSINKERKDSRNPLNDDLKSHYFIKEILNITNKLKCLETNNEAIKFLQEEISKSQSNYEPTYDSTSTTIHISLVQNLGIIGAILGEGLFKNKKEIENKIWKFRELKNIWAYYLSCKIIKENVPHKEKKEIGKNIENQLTHLLNFKILSLTNQNDIKDAWMIILKDKVLTSKTLNQLCGYARKILIPEYK